MRSSLHQRDAPVKQTWWSSPARTKKMSGRRRCRMTRCIVKCWRGGAGGGRRRLHTSACAATKEYVHEFIDCAIRDVTQDAERTIMNHISPLKNAIEQATDTQSRIMDNISLIKNTLEKVTDTQSRCLRQWAPATPFNADLWRISNTSTPQDDKDVANKAYVDYHIKNINNIIANVKTQLDAFPKPPAQQTGKHQRDGKTDSSTWRCPNTRQTVPRKPMWIRKSSKNLLKTLPREPMWIRKSATRNC